MKPCLALIAVTILLQVDCFSQSQTYPRRPQTRAEYLQRSHDQRVGGFLLLGGGVLGILAVAPGNASFGTTEGVALVSTAAVLGSIPLLLAAHRNKKKGMRMHAYIEIDKSLNALSTSFANSPTRAHH